MASSNAAQGPVISLPSRAASKPYYAVSLYAVCMAKLLEHASHHLTICQRHALAPTPTPAPPGTVIGLSSVNTSSSFIMHSRKGIYYGFMTLCGRGTKWKG